jgi:hypothetical protein
MIIPFMDVIYNKFLLPLLVCGKGIEHFVAFSIAHLEHLFHFEHIDFKGWFHNWHGYHAVEWYVHPSLGFEMNLMLLQHLDCLDLMFDLDLEDFFVSSVLTASNCIEGPKVKPTS